VNPFALGRGFLVSDPDYTPFGFSWLRGITPARLGLVALVCFVFSVRQSAYGIVSLTFLQQLPLTICYTIVYVGASLPMMVLVICADRRTRRSSSKRRIIVLSLAVVAGAAMYAAGIALVFGVSMWGAPDTVPFSLLPAISYFLRALLMGGLLTGALYFVTRERDAADALQTTRVTRIHLEKQMAEAHLRVLQAQVEPHFLFNTLAHIKRLYQIDRFQAKAMLHNLSDYLRAALPQMRQNESTLGRELALARAYLNVLQARMGERLEVVIDVPDELRQADLPPMMLSTLVENAIKHGIAPLTHGGTVKILAVRDGDHLSVSVADDGVGFQGFAGGGVGLANTRARLAALYGTEGLLTFAANPVRGVTVSVTLPYGVVSDERSTS